MTVFYTYISSWDCNKLPGVNGYGIIQWLAIRNWKECVRFECMSLLSSILIFPAYSFCLMQKKLLAMKETSVETSSKYADANKENFRKYLFCLHNFCGSSVVSTTRLYFDIRRKNTNITCALRSRTSEII